MSGLADTTVERTVIKDPVLDRVRRAETSPARAYAAFFVGRPGLVALGMFDLITGLFGPMPGAAGFWFRKLAYPRLFKRVGRSVAWGRDLALRHPGNITVGDRVGIDDRCLLDAKDAGAAGLRIGDDVLIARDTIIQSKGGWIRIGDQCVIGSQCQLSSVSGIELGHAVMVGGQCYLGGGRHHTDDPTVPMRDQGLYSKGPVVIEDDVWLGAGVIVQDGVRIGKGSVVGAGAVIREDVPPMTVVVPHQKLVLLPR